MSLDGTNQLVQHLVDVCGGKSPLGMLWRSFLNGENTPWEKSGLGTVVPSFESPEIARRRNCSDEPNPKGKRRSHLDLSSQPIIDISLFREKKEFKKVAEEFGFTLVSAPYKQFDGSAELNKDCGSKESLWLAYIRSKFQDTLIRSKKSIFTRQKSTWKPSWDKTPASITQISLVLKSQVNSTIGFEFLSKCYDQSSGALNTLGASVPQYFCVRRGKGPPIVSISVFEMALDGKYPTDQVYAASIPINYTFDGKKRLLVFELDLYSILSTFGRYSGDDKRSALFFGCLLASFYSSDANILKVSIETLEKMTDCDLYITEKPLNLFLEQIGEALLTLSLRGDFAHSNGLLASLSVIYEKYRNLIHRKTFLHLLEVISILPIGVDAGPLLSSIASQTALQSLSGTSHIVHQITNRAMTESFFSSTQTDPLSLVSIEDIEKYCYSLPIESSASSQHFMLTLLMLCRSLAATAFNLTSDALSFSASHSFVSKWKNSGKHKTLRTLAKGIFAPSNPQWDMNVHRATHLINTIMELIKEGSHHFGFEKDHIWIFDEFSCCCLRKWFMASIADLIHASITYKVGSSIFQSKSVSSFFSSLIGTLHELWGHTTLRWVTKTDIELIWKSLVSAALSDELGLPADLRKSIYAWRKAAYLPLDEISTRKHNDVVNTSLKLDVLDFISLFMLSGSPILHIFSTFDLSDSSCEILKDTIGALAGLTRKIPFEDICASTLNDTDLLTGGIGRHDEVLLLKESISGSVKVLEETIIHSLDKETQSVIGSMLSEKAKVPLNALVLLTKILEIVSDFALEDEFQSKDASQDLRLEALQFVRIGRFSDALLLLLRFYESVKGGHLKHKKRRKRRWKVTPQYLEHIVVLLHDCLVEDFSNGDLVTHFLSTGCPSPPQIVFEKEDIALVAMDFIDRIWKEHVTVKHRRCLFHSLVVIFHSVWLTIPEDFEKRKALVFTFVKMFMSNVEDTAEDAGDPVHNQIHKLDEDQTRLLSLGVVEVLFKGSMDFSFIGVLKEVGQRIGLISTDRKTSVPKALVLHLEEQLKSIPQRPQYQLKGNTSTPWIKSIRSLKKLLCSTKNELRPQKEYSSGHLSCFILNSIWQDVLPVYSKIISELISNCWRRDEAVSTLFLCLDGLLYGSLLALYADRDDLLDVWVLEIAKVRYIHMNYGNEIDTTAFASGKFVAEQQWIENVKRLAIEDKEQSYNQMDFIVVTTKEQIDFNVQQERINELQTKFDPPLELKNGARTLIRSGSFLLTDTSSTGKSVTIFLLSDICVIASEIQSSGMYKKPIIFHLTTLSIKAVESSMLTFALITKEQSLVCSAPDKQTFKLWMEDMDHFVRSAHDSHREFIQDIKMDKALSQQILEKTWKQCSMCLKPFGLFNRKFRCSLCFREIDGLCCEEISGGKSEVLCTACLENEENKRNLSLA